MSKCAARMSFGLKKDKDRRVFNEMNRAELAAKRARAVRLARRDAEYAAAHVPVTVEVRDLRNSELGQILRIETRGQAVVGAYAVNRYTHD